MVAFIGWPGGIQVAKFSSVAAWEVEEARPVNAMASPRLRAVFFIESPLIL
jgi:hypothetical protein